jgi:hypothetical protein
MFEQLPKTITLRRKNQHPIKTDQTVTVGPKDKVREVLAKTTFPKAALVSPVSGFKISPSDYLYKHVENGSVVAVAE